MNWPIVPILPTKFIEGIARYGDQAETLKTAPLDALCERRFLTDAHIQTIQLRHLASGQVAGSDEIPRVRKCAIDSLESAGFVVETTVVGVDIDTPNHVAWSSDLVSKFDELWDESEACDPILSRAAVVYSTRAGIRLFYVLKQPIKAPDSEGYIQSLLHRIRKTPLGKSFHVDDLLDCTRAFRLPRVTRDSVPTHLAPFFFCHIDRQVIDLREEIQPSSVRVRKFAKEAVALPKSAPSADEARSLLTVVSESGNLVQSEWAKRARRRLRGREVLDYVNLELKLEDSPHGRNNGLRFLVGQAISLLYSEPGTTAELIFGLLADATEQLEARTGEDDGRSWLSILWHLVSFSWKNETAQLEVKDALRVEASIESRSQLSQLICNMRAWCKNATLHSEESVAEAWVQRYLIAFVDGNYHVLKPDGYYDPVGVSLTNLSARIRELRMAGIIEVEKEVVVNGVIVRQEVPIQRIVNRHATMVSNAGAAVGQKGCTIRDIGTDVSKFVQKMYRRRDDITPRFSPDVDLWLRAFFGGYYDLGCQWIGQALNFEGGPICALSIHGNPGIGKKLLVEGLAECIDTQTTADAREMVGRFQSEMLKTPFLIVNEGLPQPSRGSGVSDPADIFRALVSGDTLHVEQKGRGIVSINNPMRIIITANNGDVISSLYRSRNLSTSDRQALGRRILHLELDDVAEKWLRGKGGMLYTAHPENRWIRGDDGSPSDCIVARHFLYLHQSRSRPPYGSRLLVEGSVNSDIVQDMAVNSGSAPEIVETILRMLSETRLPEGVSIDNTSIAVTAVGVRDFFAQWKKYEKAPALRTVSSVLKGLSTANTVRKMGNSRVRCWELDGKILLKHAKEYGHPTDILETILCP